MAAGSTHQKTKRNIAIGVVEIIFVSAWLALMLFFPDSIKLGTIVEMNVDALVRLERIYQWLDGGEWFAKILSRVGSEDHLVLHWTRPLDLIVAPLALSLKPFYGLHDAVYLAGTWAGLAVGMVFFAIVTRLPVICDERQNYMMGLSGLFVMMVPHFLYVFMPNVWPDHHGLLLVIFVSSILLTHRMIALDGRAILPLGLLLALGVWVSSEGMVALLILNAGLGLLWVAGLEKNTAKLSLGTSLATLGGIAIALLLEFATLFPGMALDRISTFSLLLGCAVVVIWFVALISERRFIKPAQRLVIGAIMAGIAGLVVFVIRPEAVRGPMADADVWFVNEWGSMYGDGFFLLPYGSALIIGIGYLSAIWLAFSQKKARIPFLLFLPVLLFYTFLMIADSAPRWVVYADIIAVIFIIPAFSHIYNLMKNKPGTSWTVIRALSVASLLILASMDTIVGFPKTEKPVTGTDIQINCEIGNAINRLEENFEDKNLVIMAHPNITPVILFHSRFRVSSVSIHTDGSAVHKTFTALTSKNETFMAGSGADLVMICPAGKVLARYGTDPESVYARLSAGTDVQGLKKLDGDYGGYLVFRVNN